MNAIKDTTKESIPSSIRLSHLPHLKEDLADFSADLHEWVEVT